MGLGLGKFIYDLFKIALTLIFVVL